MRLRSPRVTPPSSAPTSQQLESSVALLRGGCLVEEDPCLRRDDAHVVVQRAVVVLRRGEGFSGDRVREQSQVREVVLDVGQDRLLLFDVAEVLHTDAFEGFALPHCVLQRGLDVPRHLVQPGGGA